MARRPSTRRSTIGAPHARTHRTTPRPPRRRAGPPRRVTRGAPPDADADREPDRAGGRPPRHRASQAGPAPWGRSPCRTTPPCRCSSAASTRPDRRRSGFYIGRRHVAASRASRWWSTGAPHLARVLPRAAGATRWASRLRRRFGFARGVLTAYEDEQLDGGDGRDDRRPQRHPHAEIERPRVGPMRDIVATIQPEQDDLVRTDLATERLRPGRSGDRQDRRRPAPGGVPALRAPRAADAHRRARGRSQPHRSWRYIGDVLPALGEIDVEQATVERCSDAGPVRGATDPASVARLKGDARMAEVFARAVWCTSPATEHLVCPTAPPVASARYEADEVVAELRDRGVRYGAGRTMLAQRLAHEVLPRMEAARRLPRRSSPDAVARSRPVRRTSSGSGRRRLASDWCCDC